MKTFKPALIAMGFLLCYVAGLMSRPAQPEFPVEARDLLIRRPSSESRHEIEPPYRIIRGSDPERTIGDPPWAWESWVKVELLVNGEKMAMWAKLKD